MAATERALTCVLVWALALLAVSAPAAGAPPSDDDIRARALADPDEEQDEQDEQDADEEGGAEGEREAEVGPGQPGPVALNMDLSAIAKQQPDRMHLIWDPASVAWPLRPLAGGERGYASLAASLDHHQAFLEGREQAPSVRGAVELDGQRAVGVWIAALETVRVRQFGPPVPLRFIRGVDGAAAVIESARAVDAPAGEQRFELRQPPSTGAVWSIEADEPTRVMVERVAPRSVRYAAVEVEQELLEWIHEQAPVEDMPTLLVPADDLARRLRLHAALASELQRLAGADERFAEAVEAWRMLAAINQVDQGRPPVRPYYIPDRPSTNPLALEGTRRTRLDVEDSRDYRLAEQPRRWTLSRKGPGQLRISARTWAPEGQALVPAELRVYVEGRYVQRLPLSDRQAKHSADPNTALPVLEPLFAEGGPAGEFAETTLVLASGQRDYELELVGGPALISVSGARRHEATLLSVRGWTPRRRAKAAAKALAKVRAKGGAAAQASATWLELLLGRETYAPLPMEVNDPRIAALAERSPILAIHALALVAADERLDDRAIAALVEQVRPWLAALARDPSIDPAVRGELRARWLELVAVEGTVQDAGRVVEYVSGGADPITELPVEGLRLLAELFEPTLSTIRSPVLAVLELARARAPADEELREQALRLWTAQSRWSKRRPISDLALELGLPFGPRAQWLVPRKSLPSDPGELAETWLRLEVGKPLRVRAQLDPDYVRRDLQPAHSEGSEGPGAEARAEAEAVAATPAPPGRRRRLVDIHVASPLDDPAPISLRVDDSRWWSPQLAGVVRHRVALAAGLHELGLEGPADTVAWAELPPLAEELYSPEQLGRREQMWSLPDSAYYLPGPGIPGVVRLELRWPMDVEPRAVRITVYERGEYEPGTEPAPRVVLFDPRRAQVAALDPDEAALALAPVEIDHDATPLAGSPWASERHVINFPVGAAARSLSFEVEDELPITASMSLRRGLKPGDIFEGMPQARVVEDRSSYRVQMAFNGLSSLDSEAIIAELERLSRLLYFAPDDFESRARRAALLLMLGETGHARADLVRLAAWSEREGLPVRRRDFVLALLAELDRRFEALIEPREMVVTDPEIGDEPELVSPPLAAALGSDPVGVDYWLETWSRVRQLSDEDALSELELALTDLLLEGVGEDSPADLERLTWLGELSRAQVLARDPERAREASRAWIELYGRLDGVPGQRRAPLAVGLASVLPLLEHLDDPTSDARDAGVAYGLARELEPAYGHTTVRRLAFIAALRSGWDTINHSVDNSGFERLELPVSELRRSPSARVRDALLVAPWSQAEAEELRPGRKGVLAWDAQPGEVELEFWCRVARPDLGPREADLADDPPAIGPARLSVRLRDSGSGGTDLERQLSAEAGLTASLRLPIARAARHRLEVVLSPDPVWLCSWRTRVYGEGEDEPESVEPRRRAMWWTASSERAVELVVLGPASLDLEVRGITHPEPEKQPGLLLAEVAALRRELEEDPASGERRERLRSGVRERGELPLRGASERAVITEGRRRFRVNYTNEHTLLLTEPVPYRVRLSTDQGRALIRARARRDRGEVPPPAQVSLREIDPRKRIYPEDFDWRGIGPGSVVVAREAIEPIRNRVGSLDARVVLGLDDIGEFDIFSPRFGMAARVGWRRELVEDGLWMTVAAQARLRALSPLAAGGIVGLGARVDRLGLRLGATLDVLASAWEGRAVSSVRLYTWIDRPTWLGRYLQLRPGLRAGIRWQSLDAAGANVGGAFEPHPDIYNGYIATHPLFLRPELELRGYPFQDMALTTMLSLVPNSDLRSFDQLNWDLGVVGIGRRPRPWVPTWGLDYQLSNRFVDAHRSNLLLRHRIGVELGVAVWARDVARVAVGLRNQLYLNQQPGVEDVTGLVRDVIQLWIRLDGVWGRRMRDYGPGELWFGEPWAPRGWADDPHQSPSTQLRRR